MSAYGQQGNRARFTIPARGRLAGTRRYHHDEIPLDRRGARGFSPVDGPARSPDDSRRGAADATSSAANAGAAATAAGHGSVRASLDEPGPRAGGGARQSIRLHAPADDRAGDEQRAGAW